MKLTYVGTGDMNSFPEFTPAAEGGRKQTSERNVRRPNCMLIDDSLLINLPEGLFSHASGLLSAPGQVRCLLVPHGHSGHLCLEELFAPACPKELTLLCSETAVEFIDSELKRLGRALPDGIRIVELSPFVPVSANDYTITALKARRNTGEVYIHVIEHAGKRLLCANDTGFYPEETWDFLHGMVFDCVSLDITNLGRPDTADHMTLEDNLTAKKRLYQQGCIHQNTRFISTHFPQAGGLTYEDIHERLRLYGMTAAYDGMTVNI